jgi:hypothetical protein
MDYQGFQVGRMSQKSGVRGLDNVKMFRFGQGMFRKRTKNATKRTKSVPEVRTLPDCS